MTTTNSRNLGLYIHIPFCAQKCRYCAFLSFDGAERGLHSAYCDALIQEIRFWGKKSEARDLSVDTIFIGGGTPSTLPSKEIADILTACRERFDVLPDAEITIEANPGTLAVEKLNAYRDSGINRLSMGVQSLNDELLASMGRIHSADVFLSNYREARSAGFGNINLDFMFAVPGQTADLWSDTLARAIELHPEHISFYGLQIEEATPFYDMFKAGKLRPVDDETDRNMYHDAAAALQKNGYRHYEISNAARPGFSCRHNLKYWSLSEYLGLGLGAHSYLNGWRFSNVKDLASYIIKGARMKTDACGRPASKADGTGSDAFDPSESTFVGWKHQNTQKEDISEYIFTGLRLTEGISRSAFADRFSVSIDEMFKDEIGKHLAKGLLEADKEGDRLRLTADGIDLSNDVMSDFV
jgi:oxygen-independent coproporphyrinogen III oxidase